LSNTEKDGNGREREEPKGYEPEKEASGNADCFPDVADGSGTGKAEKIGWENL
jgi:hypothetical protein